MHMYKINLLYSNPELYTSSVKTKGTVVLCGGKISYGQLSYIPYPDFPELRLTENRSH